MKNIDFIELGGFPLCQDDIDYLQQGYTEVLQALVAMGNPGGGVPYVISGMAISGGGNTVSNGWFYYNGDIIQFTGGTVVPGVGEVALIVITVTSNPLTFNDTSTPAVVKNKTAALMHAATFTDATHFPVSALIPFGIGLGKANKEAFTTVAGTYGTAAVNVTINYKKNFLTNTVIVNGVMNVTNPAAAHYIDACIFDVFAILPSQYIPSTNFPFSVNVTPNTGWAITGGGIAYASLLSGYVGGNTGYDPGYISIQLPKPNGTPYSYAAYFNFEMPLD